jgi:hypothetical protein
MNTTQETGPRSMRARNGRTLRLMVAAAGLAVVALLVLGAGAGTIAPREGPAPTQAAWGGGGSSNSNFNVLETIPLADAVVANTTDVFAQGQVNCSDIWAISPSGTVSLYATVPVNDSACQEGALALAPYEIPGTCAAPASSCNVSLSSGAGTRGANAGGPNGCHHQPPSVNETLYNVINGQLFEIRDNGSLVVLVASFPVPSATSENMGLTYDQTGSWSHDLVVTSSSRGVIWTVNQTGVVTQVAKLGTYIAGPAVAPWSFAMYGGDLVVAEKSHGRVEAVSPSGTLSTVTNWTKAVGVAFQSGGGGCGGQSCSFGPDHDIFFLANYSSGAIEGFPSGDFWGLWGQGIVAGGENHGVAAFQSDGTTTLFASGTQRIGYINFITCLDPNGGWEWTPSAPGTGR